ncbi:unnamed protein product [Boreogadus saida]
MKKFNIRKVLDGLKEVSSSAPSVQVGPQENNLVHETLQSEHFQLCKTVRHGFPYQPSSMAFDPVQKILAVGTQSGALRFSCRLVCSEPSFTRRVLEMVVGSVHMTDAFALRCDGPTACVQETEPKRNREFQDHLVCPLVGNMEAKVGQSLEQNCPRLTVAADGSRS